MLSRREFFKTSGALVVSFSTPGFVAEAFSQAKPGLVPSERAPWTTTTAPAV
jgi:hypothetical protein